MARLGTWKRKVFAIVFICAGVYFILRAVDAYRTEKWTLAMVAPPIVFWSAVIIQSLVAFASKQPTYRGIIENPTKAQDYTSAVVFCLIAISMFLYAMFPRPGKDVVPRAVALCLFLFFGGFARSYIRTLRKRWRRRGRSGGSSEGDEAG